MARLTLVHGDEADRAALHGAIAAAIEACRERGIHHVSARIDVADAEAVQALEDAGFRMMDALATYIYPTKRPPPEPGKDMGVLRLYRPEDRDQILDITREAYRGFRGRYHLDPHLPRDRSDELYVEWAKKSCDGEWADVVLVTENGKGELHGWASYRQIEPVSTVGGTAIRGGGLGACRRDKPGAYAGLLRAATIRIHADGAVTEMQTQVFNFATIRLYEAVQTQFVRADYTLHAWLEE
jgi:L-amino acid N-acyltransferase YncA